MVRQSGKRTFVISGNPTSMTYIIVCLIPVTIFFIKNTDPIKVYFFPEAQVFIAVSKLHGNKSCGHDSISTFTLLDKLFMHADNLRVERLQIDKISI